jgi:ssDNA-binding Zn-finger/Zn-ribbon topoisomerase 1
VSERRPSAARTTRKPSPKQCAQCHGEMENHRWTYHPECKAAARAAALLARRRCPRCRKTRSASKFANDATRADGKFPWCVDCQTEGVANGRFQSADDELNGHACPVCDTGIRGHKNRRFCSSTCRNKANGLSKRFGLTVKQYRAMVAATGGKCPLCPARPRVWAVDHDHRSGFVTGVVCTGCNVQILAASGHDLKRARALVAYLENTPAAQLGIVVRAPDGAHRPSAIHKMWKHDRDNPPARRLA